MTLTIIRLLLLLFLLIRALRKHSLVLLVRQSSIINIGASTTAHGVWIGSGNTYLLTFHVFSFDEKGNYAGRRIIHSTIRMDGPDHITGMGTADVIAPDGKVTKNAFSAPSESTRLEVELP